MKRPKKIKDNFNAVDYHTHLKKLNKYIDYLENKDKISKNDKNYDDLIDLLKDYKEKGVVIDEITRNRGYFDIGFYKLELSKEETITINLIHDINR